MLEKLIKLREAKENLKKETKEAELEFCSTYLTGEYWREKILDYVWPESCKNLGWAEIYDSMNPPRIKDLIYNEKTREVSFKIEISGELWIEISWIPVFVLESPAYFPRPKDFSGSMGRKISRIKEWKQDILDLEEEIKSIQSKISREQEALDVLTSWINSRPTT